MGFRTKETLIQSLTQAMRSAWVQAFGDQNSGIRAANALIEWQKDEGFDPAGVNLVDYFYIDTDSDTGATGVWARNPSALPAGAVTLDTSITSALSGSGTLGLCSGAGGSAQPVAGSRMFRVEELASYALNISYNGGIYHLLAKIQYYAADKTTLVGALTTLGTFGNGAGGAQRDGVIFTAPASARFAKLILTHAAGAALMETVVDEITIKKVPASFNAYGAGGLVTNGALQKVTFDTILYAHNVTTGFGIPTTPGFDTNTGIFLVPYAGIWQINWRAVLLAGGDTNGFYSALRKTPRGGVIADLAYGQQDQAGGNVYQSTLGSFCAALNAGDALSVWVISGTIGVSLATGSGALVFSATQIG